VAALQGGLGLPSTDEQGTLSIRGRDQGVHPKVHTNHRALGTGVLV
jgi:hypothetical protein